MRNKFYVLISLSFLLMSSSVEAQSPEIVIDQLQPTIDTSAGITLGIGGQSKQRVAQTITAAHTGDLMGVFLPIVCSSGRLLIEVRNLNGDEPGDVVLAQGLFDAADVPPIGPVFRLFELDAPLSVAASERFAIVAANPEGICGLFVGPVGDSYTGGEGFFEALPNPPGWVPFSEFQNARRDIPFMTEMQLNAAVTGLTVGLDVKPGSSENTINPKSNGVIPVAVLSRDGFDAATIDPASLKFGPEQALAQGRGQLEDVNGDGLADLVLHFRTQDSGIQCGDSFVSITGQTVNGTPIQGSDSISSVGCNAAK